MEFQLAKQYLSSRHNLGSFWSHIYICSFSNMLHKSIYVYFAVFAQLRGIPNNTGAHNNIKSPGNAAVTGSTAVVAAGDGIEAQQQYVYQCPCCASKFQLSTNVGELAGATTSFRAKHNAL
jgi:hypothetical protein